MDEVVDSLNEIMSPAMQDTRMAEVGGVKNNAVINIASSPVITVAGDLPSFHYFISEQAKSMLALQELQNEVGALLEFRDMVMEAFPQLHKMPQSAVMSPTSKWEPGVRVKRKLGQQLRDQECLVSSLVPRYRSNSQGKASRSGETSASVTSSAIQDSGFCTESSKDHSSAISNRSKSRETDDELFSLLDTIQIKGTKLKLEVEYLWNRLNRKNSASFATTKRRCRSLDDLIVKNNASAETNYTFDCSVRSHFLDSELSDLKHERDLLLKKLTEIESEHIANLAQTNRLLAELETVSAEKRDLEERLQVAVSNEPTDRLDDIHRNFFEPTQASRNAQTPFAKCQLLKLVQFFKQNQTEHDNSSQRETYFTPNEQSNVSFNTAVTMAASTPKLDRPTNPLTKELSSVENKERIDLREEFDKKRRSKSKAECTCEDCKHDGDSCRANDSSVDGRSRRSSTITTSAIDQCISSIGKPDILIGFLSGHSSFIEVPKGGNISLSKEKVLSILNEYNPIELHRYLLTLTYQIDALNVHMQRISKSRMNIFQQLNRYKIENEDLRFQLEEKNIQLEGTKAKVRVLERIRNEKFCYSTSDLSTKQSPGQGSHNDIFTCPVSDTALLQETSPSQLAANKHSEKCQDLRDQSDNRTKPSSSRRITSKIPLKTNTKLPTKLSSSNKKLTSFKDCKEYSAHGPPNSSCVSSNSSSLNK